MEKEKRKFGIPEEDITSIVISDDSSDDEECREIFEGSDKEDEASIVISDDSSDDEERSIHSHKR